MIRTALMYLEK